MWQIAAVALLVLLAAVLSTPGFAADHFSTADSLALFEILHARLDSSNSATVNDLILRFPDIEFRFERGSIYRMTHTGGRITGLYFDGSGVAVFTPSDTGEARWLDGKTGGTDGVERHPFNRLFCRFAEWKNLEFSEPPVFTPILHSAPSGPLQDQLEEWLTGNVRAKSSVAPYVRLFYDREYNRRPGTVFAVYGHLGHSTPHGRHYRFAPGETKSINYNDWCCYAPENDASTPHNFARQAVRPLWYELEARIDTACNVNFRVNGRYAVLDSAVSSVFLDFAPDFLMQAIVDESDLPVFFWQEYGRWEFPGLLLLLNHMYNPGDTVKLRFTYRGRPEHIPIGEAHYFREGARWFPTTGSFYSAVFEARFICPARWTVAATGQKIKEITGEGLTTTYWVAPEGTADFAFVYGTFADKEYLYEGIPPLSIYVPPNAEDSLVQHRDCDPAAADILNALSYFRRLFGPYPFRNLTVVELCAAAATFPSLIQLPPHIFGAGPADAVGVRRGSSVARQWWDNLVRAATDEDRWFVESIVEYSSALYILKSRKRMDIFAQVLDSWRDSILTADPETVGTPLWRIGGDCPSFQRAKGAWVIHMLRTMMLDLDISTDWRFTAMLRDFLEYYRGQVVTTRDFQQQAELYYGESLDWFFRQWVYSNEIPAYSSRHCVDNMPGDGYRVHLQVEQSDVSAGFKMPIPVTITFRNRRPYHQRIWVSQPRTSVTMGPFESEPEQIIFNNFDGVLDRSGRVALPLAETDRSSP